jgi:DNA-binding NarL/FixJ family response regulator
MTTEQRYEQMLKLIAEGKGTKDIARHMGLAVGTVKCHMQLMLAKLGARNRAQAVAIWMSK